MSTCTRCDGRGLTEMSHRDGGMCYLCGALPAYRGDTDDEPTPLTYWEARDRYGRVIDILTWYMHNGANPAARTIATDAVHCIRRGATTEVDVMWRRAHEIRDTHRLGANARPRPRVEYAS